MKKTELTNWLRVYYYTCDCITCAILDKNSPWHTKMNKMRAQLSQDEIAAMAADWSDQFMSGHAEGCQCFIGNYWNELLDEFLGIVMSDKDLIKKYKTEGTRITPFQEDMLKKMRAMPLLFMDFYSEKSPSRLTIDKEGHITQEDILKQVVEPSKFAVGDSGTLFLHLYDVSTSELQHKLDQQLAEKAVAEFYTAEADTMNKLNTMEDVKRLYMILDTPFYKENIYSFHIYHSTNNGGIISDLLFHRKIGDMVFCKKFAKVIIESFTLCALNNIDPVKLFKGREYVKKETLGQLEDKTEASKDENFPLTIDYKKGDSILKYYLITTPQGEYELSFDEALGLLAAIMVPKGRGVIKQWLNNNKRR